MRRRASFGKLITFSLPPSTHPIKHKHTHIQTHGIMETVDRQGSQEESGEEMLLFTVTTIVIDVIIIILTLAGNTLTICAISMSRRLSELLSNKFILSLAVSDLLVGLTIPYHLAFALDESLGSRKDTCVLRFVLIILACSSSIYNLLAIAADRYIAIMLPFFYSRNVNRRVASLIISIGWYISITVATMPIYWNDYKPGKCTQDKFLPKNYVNFIITPMFLSIWLVMSLLYIRIWREAVGHAKRLRGAVVHQVPPAKDCLKENKSIQMVLLILGCFSVCWFPYFFVITYTRMIGTNWPDFYEAAFTLAVSNSCMNPLIYAWKSKNYRDAFCCLLRCKSPKIINRKQFDYVTDHVRTVKLTEIDRQRKTENDTILSTNAKDYDEK